MFSTPDTPVLINGSCREYRSVSRRDFLTRGAQSAVALLLGNPLTALPAWMPRFALADPQTGPRGDTLVCIFLRGGADGLNIVVPHGERAYYDHRQTIGILRPDDGRTSQRALDLDGFFGLHPALAALHPLFDAKQLALVHAVGSPDETRSHFEAMDLMERGAVTNGDYTGWLARHLATLDTGNPSSLRAIGIGDMLPAALSGTVSATALQSLSAYHLLGQEERASQLQEMLQRLYSGEPDMLTTAAQQTLDTLTILNKIQPATDYKPAGRLYPQQEFGQALTTVAQLIKAEVGVEVACIDFGGWDTHVAQGGGEGLMANLLTQLATGLAAFQEDLDDHWGQVTVVVMSEFGRRLQENGGLGTDHGHGNMMMVLGGGINGGQVYGRWPGLAPEQLVGPGDLAVTTDYRDVLGELLHRRLNNGQMTAVFPGYTVTELGLAVPR